MGYNGVHDLRTYSRVALTSKVVAADTNILSEDIINTMTNTDISFYTIMAVPTSAGKFYLVKQDGSHEFISGSESGGDWPAKVPLLVTYVLAKGDSFNIRFSNNGTLSSLIITEHGGVY